MDDIRELSRGGRLFGHKVGVGGLSLEKSIGGIVGMFSSLETFGKGWAVVCMIYCLLHTVIPPEKRVPGYVRILKRLSCPFGRFNHR